MTKTLNSRLNRSRTEHRREMRTENVLQTEKRCDLTGTDGVHAIDSLGDSQGDRGLRDGE